MKRGYKNIIYDLLYWNGLLFDDPNLDPSIYYKSYSYDEEKFKSNVLIWAAIRGHLDILRVLFRPMYWNKFDQNMINNAIARGRVEAVKEILAKPGIEYGQDAIILAIKLDNSDNLIQIIEDGKFILGDDDEIDWLDLAYQGHFPYQERESLGTLIKVGRLNPYTYLLSKAIEDSDTVAVDIIFESSPVALIADSFKDAVRQALYDSDGEDTLRIFISIFIDNEMEISDVADVAVEEESETVLDVVWDDLSNEKKSEIMQMFDEGKFRDEEFNDFLKEYYNWWKYDILEKVSEMKKSTIFFQE
jgi:hypothetical protein